MILIKIISGGQTGADRAGLDIAIRNNILHGGWIPKGRMTEEGPLSSKYNLKEMETTSYPKRTEKNVLDSDGTVIISFGKLKGGSALTRKIAEKYKRLCLYIDLEKVSVNRAGAQLAKWIRDNSVNILNVAGPRASEQPKIYDNVLKILEIAIGICRE